ncbi:hypothetical protein BC832DRAFT_614985 [Gaertneriomyces semiglobifer]|nr:hypothetical protein BC832DRAFT_614985 [Gaertneriomyces semiglobifer]
MARLRSGAIPPRSYSVEFSRRYPFVVAQQVSNSQEEHGTTPLTGEALHRNIHDVIINRMITDHLSVDRMVPALTAFLCQGLSRNGDRLRACALELMRNQLQVSDKDMINTLKLVESTEEPTSGSVEDGTELFYIRSWPITATDLAHIVATWEEDGITPPEAWNWLGTIQLATNPDTVFHIRYVGKCMAPTTPHQRFIEDSISRNSGMLPEFLTALEQHAPDSYAAGRTYEIQAARLPSFASPEVRDDRERAIIAYFDKRTLLNQQSGGFYASYVPSIADHVLFTNLGTSFFTSFAQTLEVAPDEMVRSIDGWITELELYAENHPAETGTALHPIPVGYMEMLKQQAMPYLCHGHVIGTILGKDITREDYFGCSSFFGGRSRAGHLVKDFLSRLEAYEKNQMRWDGTFETRTLSFIDVYPWLVHRNIAAILELVTMYLRITRPLVVLSMGQLPSSCAKANFIHTSGLPSQNYISQVGIPSIQTYADQDWLFDSAQTTPPAGFSFIMIPHLHPGYDKYGQQPVQLRRVYDLTWQLSIYILNQALILAGQAASSGTPGDHDTLVNALYHHCRYDDNMGNVPLKNLYKHLEGAKQDLQTYQQDLRAVRGHASIPEFTPQVRALMSERSKERMLRGQQAVGAGRSNERRQQVDGLWKMQLPDVMLHVPPNTTNRERVWKRWAMSLDEGMFYYASSLNRTQYLRPIAGLSQSVINAIRMFRPQGVAVDDDEWMNDRNLVDEALRAKSRHMASFLPDDFFTPERQRQRRVNALRGPLYEFHENLEGTQVVIQAKGTMVLRWRDVSTVPATDIVFLIQLPKAMVPLTKDDVRIVRFLANGIGLTDGTGNVITRPGYGSNQGVFSRNDFLFHAQSAALDRCWRANAPALQRRRSSVLSRILGTSNNNTTTAAPVPMAMPKGRGMIKQQHGPSHANRQLPINPNDAAALLRDFLNEEYAAGGTFNLADPSRAPGLASASLVSKFNQYLEDRHDHPYYLEWKVWFTPGPTYGRNVRHIVANLKFLRPGTTTESRQVRLPSSNRRRTYDYSEVDLAAPSPNAP